MQEDHTDQASGHLSEPELKQYLGSSEESQDTASIETPVSEVGGQPTTPVETVGTLEYHPLANAFPLIEGEEFEAFREDISQNGQREPIVLHEGKILDGRNRYRALVQLGITPATEIFSGENPLHYVLSMNMYRRQLTIAQRSMIAAEIVCREQTPETEGDADTGSHIRPGLSLAQASTLLGISERSISSATRVAKNGVDDLLSAVKSGKVKISAAEYVARLDQQEQEDLCAAGAKAIRDKARQMRLERRKSAPENLDADADADADADDRESGSAAVADSEIKDSTATSGSTSTLPESASFLYQFARAAKAGNEDADKAADKISKELEMASSYDIREFIFAAEVAGKVREKILQRMILQEH